jgi:hypothetical protein
MKYSQGLISKSVTARSLVALFAVLSCVSAQASADEPAFTMTAIIDSAHGGEIAAGKYAQAIEKIAAINDGDAFFNNTNLCVAYTKTRNLYEAKVACELAVEQADSMTFDRRSDLSKSAQERARRKFLAMALSNRGVLLVVTGNVELAHRDFVKALSIGNHTKVVKVNLARLGEVEAEKV